MRSPTGRPPAAPLGAAGPVRVRAAAIGLDSVLIGLGLDPHGALEVPADGTVAGWHSGGPTPGEVGPAVLAAHVDWDRAPGAFAGLARLAPGDLVAVERTDGTVAWFEVQAVHRYAKDRFPTAAVYGGLDRAALRLVTCGGSFDRAARGYRDNVVAYAALVRP